MPKEVYDSGKDCKNERSICQKCESPTVTAKSMTQAMIAAAVDAKALAQPLAPGADGSLVELDAAPGAHW